jgi:putative ABC transport system ATP-binding protein
MPARDRDHRRHAARQHPAAAEAPPADLKAAGKVSQEEHQRFIEAIRSGNTPFAVRPPTGPIMRGGLAMRDSLAAHVRTVLDVLGCAEDVYELGLDGKVLPCQRAARSSDHHGTPGGRGRAQSHQAGGLIETFEPDRYNANAHRSART